MKSDQFTVLQAEFETATKRLKEIDEPSERRALLRELRRTLDKLDAIVLDEVAGLIS